MTENKGGAFRTMQEALEFLSGEMDAIASGETLHSVAVSFHPDEEAKGEPGYRAAIAKAAKAAE